MDLLSEQGTPAEPPAPADELSADAVVRALLDGAGRLAEGTTEDAVCFATLEVIVNATGARGGAIRMVEQGQLLIVHQVGRRPRSDGEQQLLAQRFAPLPLDGSSAAGIVAMTQRPLVFEQPADFEGYDERVVPDRSSGHAYLPLVIGGRTIGTVGMGFDGFRRFPADVRHALEVFATQAALAIERVRLVWAQGEALTALAVSAARTAALQRVTRAFARSSTVEEVFAAALDAVDDALQPDAALAVRVDEDGVRCVDARGGDAPRPDELLGYPFTTSGPLGPAVRRGSANWFDAGLLAGDRPGLGRAGGAVPLLVDGGPAGALAVLYAHPRPVPPADRTLLASIAELCAEALRRAQQEERERRLVEQRLSVRGAGQDIARAATVDAVLEVAVRAVGAVGGHRAAAHAAVDDGQGGARLVRLEARAATVVAEDVAVEAVPSLLAMLRGTERPAQAGVSAALTVEDRTVGVLTLERHGTEIPPPDVVASVQSIAMLAAEGVNRVRILEAKQRADAHAAALHRVTRTLSRSATIDEVLQAALAVLREVLDPVRGGAVLVEEDGWPSWQLTAGSAEVVASRRRERPEEPVLSVLTDGTPRFYESAGAVLAEFGPAAAGHFRCAGLHLPLQVGGVTVGAMGCEFAGARRLSVEERALALSLASLSAEAVRRARLYEEAQRNAGRHAMLRALGDSLATTTVVAEALDTLGAALRAHLGPLTLLAVLERGGLLQPLDGPEPPIECLAAALEGQPTTAALAHFPGEETIRWPADAAGVPIGFDALCRDTDAVLGVVSVRFAEPLVVRPDERAVVADAVAMAREALRRARSLAQQRRGASRARALHRITESFSRASTTEAVLRVAVTELHRTLEAVATAAGVVRDGAVAVVEALGEVAWMTTVPPVPVDTYWPVAEALRTGQPVWHEPDHPVLHERPAGQDDGEYTEWSSGVVLPIMVDGDGVGALSVGLAGGRHFEPGDRDLLGSVVRLCGEALRRARLYDEATAAAGRYEALFGVYERLFRRHPQPMAILDAGGLRFFAANDAHERMFGYTEEELLHVAPSSLVVGQTGAQLAERAEQIGDEPDHIRIFPFMRFRRKDGSSFIGRLTTSPADYEGMAARLALITDETARVEAERDRARLQERVLTAAEEERRRISLDLHDGPIQDLSIAVMRLSAMRHAMGRGESPSVERLLAVEEGARLTVDELRNLMQRLYPGNLEESGLGELLRDVAAGGPWSPAVTVCVEDHFEGPLPLPVKAAAYRVVVEALTNVWRHAAATRATVRLEADGDALHLRIADDGVGIGDALHQQAGHLGLTSMQDRIALLGGRCTVGAGADGGTVVEAWVPCSPPSVERTEH